MRIKNHAVSLLPRGRDDNGPRPWGAISTTLLTVAVYFGSQIIGGILLYIVVSFFGFLKRWNLAEAESWMTNSVYARFLLILFIESLVVGGVYFLLHMRKMKPKDIGIVKPKLVDGLYALAGFGIYFISYVLLFFAVRYIFPQIDLDQKQQIGFDTAQQGIELLVIFCSLVILPPIAEEVLVRGFLYTGLRTKFTLWPAAIVASTLFAIAHLQFGSGAPLLWAAAIDTFVLSMVLIYIREQRRSLVAPILIHMMKNGLAFFLLFVLKVG